MPITELGEIISGNLTDTGEIINAGITETGAVTFGAAVVLLKEIADSLLAADAVMRHKPALVIADRVCALDLLHKYKALTVADSLALAEAYAVVKTMVESDSLRFVDAESVPSRVLHALDLIGSQEDYSVGKVLLLSQNISIAEVIEGGGLVRRTKLFLVLGDLAIQLYGD
jgi:hypothetical protein